MQYLAPLTLALEDWNITIDDLVGDVSDSADEYFALPRLVRAHIEPCGPVAEAMTPWRRDAIAAATKKAASGQPDKAAAPAAKVESTANARPTARKATAAVVQLSEEDFQEDWYELLGLSSIGEAATEEQIRAAFRRRCLETHPDKYQGSDELFKKVGRAFEILNNADAKRSFDSAREFDESIPDEKVAPDQFYDSFGTCFVRNMRFSTVPTARTIGDDTTPVAEVQAFYDFWLSFRSWRDFSHAAELEEIHEGMAREEKRYYARENERILSGLKKQESKRVRNLVDRAMANDPRLKRHAAEEEAKRLDAQRARQEALEYARNEAQRRRDEEARKVTEAEDAVKRKAAEERSALKAGKVKVVEILDERGILDSGFKSLAFDDEVVRSSLVDWVFKSVTPQEAPNIAAQVEGWTEDDTVQQFNALVESIERKRGSTRYGEPVKKELPAPVEAPKPAAAAANVATAVWGDEDIAALKRAIAKFPGGSVDRWRRIAMMLREKYTEEQVLTKTKELEANMRAGAGAQDAAAATASAAPAAAAAVAAAASATATEEDWTPKQQQQLEGGLRALKDYKEKDKFIKVAEQVDGKTAKQCFERFKYLCSLAKK